MDREKYYSYFWGAIIISAPLFLKTTGIIDNPLSKDFFFIFSVSLSLILFGIPKIDNFSKIIFGYLISDIFFNQWLHNSQVVIIQWIMISFGILLLVQMSAFTFKFKNIISYSLIITCLIQSISVFLNYYYYFNVLSWAMETLFNSTTVMANNYKNIIKPGDFIHITGTLGNRLYAAALIACTTPFFFNKNFIYFLPIPIWALILCDCTTPIIAFIYVSIFFILTIYGVNKIKIIITSFFVGISGFVSILFFKPSVNNLFFPSNRFEVWKAAVLWPSTLKEIIFGFGPGYFHDQFDMTFKIKEASGAIYRNPHNELISIYLLFGLIGVALVGYSAYNIFKVNENNNPDFLCCLIALGICSMTAFPFHIAPTALIGIVSYSIIINSRRQEYGNC